MNAESNLYQYPWVIFKLQNEFYGIATSHVQTMVAMPDIVDVPHKLGWSRGVINLRKQVLPLVDLRLRLGMPSFTAKIDGLVDMVQQREQDHCNWLDELENSVMENREFTLTTDPHKCKFGQWYDSYKPVSLTESQMLQHFGDPHRRIHGIAHNVQALVAQNQTEQALALIENCRNGDFATMQKLFSDFRKFMRELAATEIAIVLENVNRRIAVAVDAVESVEMLAENSVEEMPEILRQKENSLGSFVARRKKSNHIVYLIDTQRIIEENHPEI